MHSIRQDIQPMRVGQRLYGQYYTSITINLKPVVDRPHGLFCFIRLINSRSYAMRSIPSPQPNEIHYVYYGWQENPICIQVRVEKNEGKDFYTLKHDHGVWKRGAPDGGKPIYNLLSIKKNPDKPILFVEGEKTADAAIKLFPDFNVITCLGGASSLHKADLSALKDKTVYLFPDNDKAGYKGMEKLKDELVWVAKVVYLIDIKSLGVKEKWDLADFNEDNDEVDFDAIKELFNIKPSDELFSIDRYPHLSDSSRPKPLDTCENLRALLAHYKITVRWNMLKHIRETTIPHINFYEEEADNASLNYIIDLAVLNGLPHKRLDKHLDQIAWENTYHPVRDWILSKPLADASVFSKFLSTIQTTDNDLAYILIKRWMISAIALLFTEKGFSAQGVLVIQGEPHTHKSSFVMSLVPEPLKAVKGGLSLDPSRKDDILTASEYWICELGELDATFRKADIARLKSHITNDIDDVRRPYAIRNSRLIRRTAYAATVNESHFLVDSTGNRRWWTISLTEPIDTRHGLDMQQIWRYAYEMYIQGESPFLSKDELNLLNESNKKFEFIDPFEEKLEQFFDWEWPERIWMTATEVLEKIGYEKPNKSDATRMGSLLKKRNIPKGIGRKRRHYHMPKFLNSNEEW